MRAIVHLCMVPTWCTGVCFKTHLLLSVTVHLAIPCSLIILLRGTFLLTLDSLGSGW